MKKYIFLKNHLLVFINLLSIIIFIAFNFQDTRLFDGWQKLTFPTLPGDPKIQDMTFVDSLTGYAVTKYDIDTAYILKSTNGGLNWTIIRRDTVYLHTGFFRLWFLNKDTGFVLGNNGLERTTNGGINWINLPLPSGSFKDNMWVFSIDTIWVVDGGSLNGGIWRSIDGGYNWIEMSNGQYMRPDKIYFYNSNIGFVFHYVTMATDIYKTTNGGFNWTPIPVSIGFLQMIFVDSLRGFKVFDNLEKTTNGGLNWIPVNLPDIPGMFNTAKWIESLAIFSDTFYCFGSIAGYPNYKTTVLVYKSTNLGLNWGYQIIDTSFNITRCQWSSFTNNQVGWCYNDWHYFIRTTNGGGTTTFTNIKEQITNISSDFILYQNYPNPFNLMTKIKYSLKKSGVRSQELEVKLIVYDVSGKRVSILVNQQQKQGDYEVSFNGYNLSSGIYFYTLFIDGVRVDTKKMALIK
jgi:hypothetical protein